jgi:hypothetical protein
VAGRCCILAPEQLPALSKPKWETVNASVTHSPARHLQTLKP